MDEPAITSTSTDILSVPENFGPKANSTENPASDAPSMGSRAVDDTAAPHSSSGEQREVFVGKIPTVDNTSQKERQAPWIRYRVEYKDPIGGQVIYSSASHTPIAEEHANIGTTNEPVFELVTTYKAQPSGDQELPRSRGDQAEGGVPPRQALGSAASYNIVIYSTAIINALHSDIGTDPSFIELNLTKHFKTATSWGAVLLIDEADVFMERRGSADLVRNSLVAGFLRALEFYEGILFLTTNRVGAFDDAFISRVHIKLYYPDFGDTERQKVWNTFVKKLSRERENYMRVTIDAKEYIESKQLREIPWNGREIRNAFQTAVSLAEYENKKDSEGNIMLTEEHLKSVVELSKDFKNYLDKLHLADESKRALARKERLDTYVS
ncbi:hypothetical protein N8I77_010642 [Diaporthe amygdali]|uniref:ATPase AAA-type core domain-containing protein n=1 Tax=Phomopsis amygdali TaxID=1214568 RepID=A0AAD9S8S1_PHOAM|nr:hypothetical protein N8I77_010642 [Diaporthe amygdali]